MNNILHYIDMILLTVLLLFLLLYFKRLLGKKIGYQKQEQEVSSTSYSETPVTNENTKILNSSQENLYKYPIGSLMQKMEIIEANDNLFSSKSFINSSKKAFEMIVKSFNSGNIVEVKDFLSDKVYQTFSSNIEARADDKKKIHVEIKQFILSDIVEIKINDNFDAFISVKYLTLQVRGEGENQKAIELAETWVFSKNIKENISIWKLVKTY